MEKGCTLTYTKNSNVLAYKMIIVLKMPCVIDF